MGVSINTGVAMVGYIGTRERAEFNALGDVVNIVFRMQEYSRPNRIVVGPATVAAIIDTYPIQRIGAVTLKEAGRTLFRCMKFSRSRRFFSRITSSDHTVSSPLSSSANP
jgi:class 3 adenylate cyclase